MVRRLLTEPVNGQYLTIKVKIPEQKYTHIRHYSLSEAPGKDYCRISFKREDET